MSRNGSPVAAVTGATGCVARALIPLLLAEGFSVRGLTLTPAPAEADPAVEYTVGEINDTQLVRRFVAGADYVFHLAALLHIPNPSPALYCEYQRVNVTGTQTVVAASRSVEVRRLVYISTISVYGSSYPGQLLTESSPLCPDSVYANTKLTAEGAVLAEKKGVVLRMAAVYGPHMRGNYRRMLNALRRGFFATVGPGDNRRTLIHEMDAARALLYAATRESGAQRVFNVTDGSVHTLDEIVAAASHAIGRSLPVPHLPAGALRAIALRSERLCCRLGVTSPVTTSTIAKLTEDVAVSGDAFIRQYDFVPQFDLAAGWCDAVKRSGG
jgi:nucleoside-diphosphate-sugar epimerase